MERWSIQILDQTNKDSTVQRTTLTKLNKQLTNLCNETGLEKDYSRTKIANYTSTKSNNSGKISKTTQNKEKTVQYIGKLDKNKLGKYADKVITDEVIMTNERIEHTNKRHPGDYDKYIKYVPDIIKNPDYILEDIDNVDTILVLKSIKEKGKNIQVVVKLQTNKEEAKSNSILTFWHIRDRNYRGTIKNNEIIYQK